ncbi:MAG: type IX secretion system sortase PorU [Ignavibacteria bacterium]|nr:type IX secretion system sortase PorU [Ignavibacteria bacterium]
MKSKVFLVLQLICFTFGFCTSVYSEDNNISITLENQSNLNFVYKPSFHKFDTIIVQNDKYLIPIFNEPTYLIKNQDGSILVAIQKLIAVPDSNSFQIIKAFPNNLSLFEGKIPSPEILASLNSLLMSNSLPNEINLFDDFWAFAQYIGIGRNLPLAQLFIVVAKYYPQTNSIYIPNSIDIDIQFKPTYRLSTQEIYQDIINVKQAKDWLIELDKPNPIKTKKEDEILSQNNTFVKIKIGKEGIYRIDASMLSSIGINIPSNLINTIKIYGGDGKPLIEPPTDPKNNSLNQIPIIVRTKQNGELDYILFYGIGTQGFEYSSGIFRFYQNPYSNFNYYLLTWGGDTGLRIQPIQEPEKCDNPIIPQSYVERIYYLEEITNPFNSGSGNIWFGASIFPRYFANPLHDLNRNGEILYRFYVAQNYTDEMDNLFGQFTFFEGNNKIGEVYIPKCVTYEEAKARIFEGKLSAMLLPSDNRSYLKIEYKTPTGATSSATPFFNRYEIHYPRQFKAIDKSIGFFTDPKTQGCYEYQISGFDGEIVGLDVTDPTYPLQINNRSVVLNAFNFRVQLDSNQIKRFYISSNFIKPEIQKIEIAGLRTNPLNSEVLVITHSSLLNSAKKYKEFREKTTNLKISVVNIEDIYNEYSYGIPDPMAIRYFLSDALMNWSVKPFYVILWGDGHYDFRNIATKKTNFVPAFQVSDNLYSFTSTVSYTSDDFYAFLIGNDWVIDVAIARIPIYDDQTGMIYVDKLINYDTSQDKSRWRTTVLFCADDSPQSKNSYDGTLHTRDSELIANNYVPSDFLVKKIYLPEYPTENIPGGRRKPLATADLVRTINEGTLLVNWLGHGNPRVWAHEELFDRDQTISLFSNKDKLFVGIAATCDFGRYDMTDIKSGTEELLFYRKGGAIAYFSATRAVYTTDNRIFNENIIKEIFKRNKNGNYQTLGEAYFQVKQKSIGDNHRKYLLFGDPLITPIIPENIVRLNKINQINLLRYPIDSTVYINANTRLIFEGQIINPKDSSLIKNFNGFVEIVVNDVGYYKIVTDIDNSKHSIYKEGGIIAKGTFAVKNGTFNGEFFITDELSFLKGNISIKFFASDTANNIFAKGYENRIKIAGIDTTNTFFDSEPPIISIYIDDTTFNNGDVVSNPPTLIVKLYDNTAINTTGVGIGHLIEAWIDDNPESIDLTNFYESSTTNPKEGIIKKPLNILPPGKHIVKVRAWDIFNNFSIQSAEFTILDPSAGIILLNPLVLPNPAQGQLAIRVQHNINEPYEVTLKVYNYFGQTIFESSKDFNKLKNFEISYDCKDFSGNILPSGIYIYSINVKTNTKNASISGKFAIVR